MIGPKSKYRNSSHLFFDLQSWDRAVGSTKTKKIRKSSPRNRKRIATQSPKRFMAQSLANNSKQFLKWLEGMFVLRCFQYYRNAKLYKLLFWNKKHATLEVTMLLSENSEIPNKRHKRSFWPNTPDLSWCKTLFGSDMSCYVNHIRSLFCCMPALKLNSYICWWIVHLYLFFDIFSPETVETRATGPVEIARHFKNTNSGGGATLTKLEVIQAGSLKFLVYSWWLIDPFNKKRASGNVCLWIDIHTYIYIYIHACFGWI